MGTRIHTNVGALFATLSQGRAFNAAQNSLQRLSSGLRVYRAADDVGAISPIQRFRHTVAGLTQSAKNASEAATMIQVADSGAAGIVDLLNKIRVVALQASNGTIDSAARLAYVSEYSSLKSEIQRSINTSKYGDIILLKTTNNPGTTGLSSSVVSPLPQRIFLLGPSADVTNSFRFYQGISSVETSLRAASASGSALQSGTVSSISSARSVVTAVDAAVKSIGFFRAVLGASQDFLQTASGNDETSSANHTSALSSIQDVDFGTEVAAFTAKSLLSQSNLAFMAQANLMAQSLLTLLA